LAAGAGAGAVVPRGVAPGVALPFLETSGSPVVVAVAALAVRLGIEGAAAVVVGDVNVLEVEAVVASQRTV